MKNYFIYELLTLSFLEILLTLFIAMFDHVHYQHTVLSKDSPKKAAFQYRGNLVNIALVIVYLIWMSYYFLYEILYPMIREWVSWEYFFQSTSLDHQVILCILILLHGILGVFFIWPSFRSYILSKLYLDPQRYIHCIAVWWMVSCLIDYIAIRGLPFLLHKDSANQDLIKMLSILKILLVILLAIGAGIHRNAKEAIVRLGLNIKPTWKNTLSAMYLIGSMILLKIVYSFIIDLRPWEISFHIIFDLILGILMVVLAIGKKEIKQHLVSSRKFTMTGILFFIMFYIPIFIKLFIVEEKVHHHDVSLSLSIVSIIATVILVPMVEELFFRGALQPWMGIWITSISFALMHPQYSLQGFYYVFLASLLYGRIARQYSIWLSIGAHILNNFLAVMIR